MTVSVYTWISGPVPGSREETGMTRRSSNLALLLALCLLVFAATPALSEEPATEEPEPASAKQGEKPSDTDKAETGTPVAEIDPEDCKPAYATLEDIFAGTLHAVISVAPPPASEVTVEWLEIPVPDAKASTAENETEKPARAD
jgi:hypothetical protein